MAPISSPPASISVQVDNVRGDLGLVRVAVCDEHDFLKSCAYSADAPATAGSTVVKVPGVPPGRYAVQAFQDERRLGHVRRNILGIPLDGVGFSNDAPVVLGPPRFATAAFLHGDHDQRITLKLRYFLP